MGLKFFTVITLTLTVQTASIATTGVFAAAHSQTAKHRSGSHNAILAGDIGPTDPSTTLLT